MTKIGKTKKKKKTFYFLHPLPTFIGTAIIVQCHCMCVCEREREYKEEKNQVKTKWAKTGLHSNTQKKDLIDFSIYRHVSHTTNILANAQSALV